MRVAITIGRTAEHADLALFGTVVFVAVRALQNLGADAIRNQDVIDPFELGVEQTIKAIPEADSPAVHEGAGKEPGIAQTV